MLGIIAGQRVAHLARAAHAAAKHEIAEFSGGGLPGQDRGQRHAEGDDQDESPGQLEP